MRNDNKLECKEVELNARDSQNLLLLVLSPPVLTGFLSQGGAKLRDFLPFLPCRKHAYATLPHLHAKTRDSFGVLALRFERHRSMKFEISSMELPGNFTHC